MATDIDWDFIAEFEGKAVTVGYVPNPTGSQSGVTIATGFDIGQRNAADMNGMDIAQDLKAKLMPYVLMKGPAALDFLNANPLVITDAEVQSIDDAVHESFTAQLVASYNGAVSGKPGLQPFDGIIPEAQTVIASVAYQYGTNLARATPRFWGDVTSQNWPQTVTELRNFGDAYPTRRNKEADLLEGAIAIS